MLFLLPIACASRSAVLHFYSWILLRVERGESNSPCGAWYRILLLWSVVNQMLCVEERGTYF